MYHLFFKIALSFLIKVGFVEYLNYFPLLAMIYLTVNLHS